MKGLIVGLVLIASPATAGPVLWQNVEAGMTVEEVQALYPAAVVRRNRLDIRDYRPIPQCPSTVRVMFEAGVVHAIQVRGAGAVGGICSEQIEGALIARYGQPIDRDFEMGWLLNVQTTETYTYIWQHNGVVMRYRRIDGAGLGAPSWIMEYVSLERLERERQEKARIGL